MGSVTDASAVDAWWKNTVVYCVDTKTWLDSNGDGIGDLPGLTSGMAYLSSLGVNCLWLMPVCRSPWRDDGYDVADYFAVDPRLGTPGDFVTMVRAAHAAGVRVLLDLPLNHVSVEHPWFQSARSSRESPYRDYFVWRDEPPPNPPAVVFPGEQQTTWTRDEQAGQYYMHRYYDFMPDLNTRNPAVREEMYEVLGYWLALGVDGFRVDSVPFLVEEIDTGAGEEASHDYLRDLRAFLSRRNGSAVLLGEANLPPEQLQHYFGDSGAEEMHMLYDFLTGPAVWLALTRGDASPIVAALGRRPKHPPMCQYLTFLRHHDELTFEHVMTEQEAKEVFDRFAPRPEHRIYDRGIRRRLAPMLDGDIRRLRLALSLLLALPGAPMILYGDELGAGDDLALEGRFAVRPPMPWSHRHNAGFSTADPDALIRPVRADGQYGHRSVNVTAQLADRDSLLGWFRDAVAVRRQCPAVGWTEAEPVDTGDRRVLALHYRWHGQDLLLVHNLADEPAEFDIGALGDLSGDDVFADARYPALDGGRRRLPIGPYGYRWLRLHDDGAGAL